MASINSDKMFVKKEQGYIDSWAIASRGRTKQYRVWVSDRIGPKVATLSNGKEQISILSVGAGNGAFDLMLLEELTNVFKLKGQADKQIIYHVLEPNIKILEIFKKKTEGPTLRNLLSNVQFLWINKSFEDYTHNSQNQVKYDLIVLCHCLYYMNEAEVLRESLVLLMQNGFLLVVVGTEGNIWTKLRGKYENIVSSLAGYNYLTATSISGLAKSNDWCFESFAGKRDLEITEIFDENSEVGNKLLEFFFHHENPKETFDIELLKDIVDFFNENKKENVELNTGDGKQWYAQNDDGVVLIYKD